MCHKITFFVDLLIVSGKHPGPPTVFQSDCSETTVRRDGLQVDAKRAGVVMCGRAKTYSGPLCKRFLPVSCHPKLLVPHQCRPIALPAEPSSRTRSGQVKCETCQQVGLLSYLAGLEKDSEWFHGTPSTLNAFLEFRLRVCRTAACCTRLSADPWCGSAELWDICSTPSLKDPNTCSPHNTALQAQNQNGGSCSVGLVIGC